MPSGKIATEGFPIPCQTMKDHVKYVTRRESKSVVVVVVVVVAAVAAAAVVCF